MAGPDGPRLTDREGRAMTMKTIVLIDDEEDIREVAALTLETMGDFKVFAAANGFDGVELVAAVQPDAVLLDVMMPDIDGPTTLGLIREREVTREIPVIFMTAKVQASDRRSLSSMGVSGIISKPFDPMNLAAEVDDILKRHSERSGGPSRGNDKGPAASDNNAEHVDHQETIQARMSCEVLAACGISKEAFLENLDERLRSLKEALETIIDTGGERLESVVREFHNLAGIAGTYDFPEVSQLAGRGERLLECVVSEGRMVRAADVAAAKALVKEMDGLRSSAVV
jgi:two-component system, OmpR family, alkaline phosphatase synthesis response regulator PhoP